MNAYASSEPAAMPTAQAVASTLIPFFSKSWAYVFPSLVPSLSIPAVSASVAAEKRKSTGMTILEKILFIRILSVPLLFSESELASIDLTNLQDFGNSLLQR